MINRLKSAEAENPDLEEQMHVEDEYLAELIKRDNLVNFYKEKWEKGQVLILEKEQAILEKDRLILDLAKSLKEVGFSLEQIQEKTGLVRDIIENL